MKKVFKKIMYTLLLIVISICSLPMITNAKEVHDTITIDRSYSFYVATTKLSDPSKWVYSVQNVVRRTSDWNIGYCLQAHVLLTDGASVTGYSDMNDKLSLMNLTEAEIERIELIAYYGYGYTNHISMDWYAATQLLIWGITDKDSVPYPIEEGDRTLVRSSRYDSLWPSVIYRMSTGNSDMVQIVLSQVGSVGGQPYWSWYGFSSRVEWCAVFVSWVANQNGYIERGIIPKFSVCETGAKWFKDKGKWQPRSYIPSPGDIIFFDWELDGRINHVGIVEKVEDNIVYTIERNSNDDMCRQKEYKINNKVIVGYGTPAY